MCIRDRGEYFPEVFLAMFFLSFFLFQPFSPARISDSNDPVSYTHLILKSEPERRENLWKITNYALDCFRQAGFEIGDTESPIIPLYVRDTDKTFEVTKLAFDEGIFINPVIPPACAPQDTLVRVALMATHTKEQVDYAVDKLTKCFKKLEIIK